METKNVRLGYFTFYVVRIDFIATRWNCLLCQFYNPIANLIPMFRTNHLETASNLSCFCAGGSDPTRVEATRNQNGNRSSKGDSPDTRFGVYVSPTGWLLSMSFPAPGRTTTTTSHDCRRSPYTGGKVHPWQSVIFPCSSSLQFNLPPRGCSIG